MGYRERVGCVCGSRSGRGGERRRNEGRKEGRRGGFYMPRVVFCGSLLAVSGVHLCLAKFAVKLRWLLSFSPSLLPSLLVLMVTFAFI